MDRLTGQPPPHPPWAVRKFGIEHYTFTMPRVILAVVGSVVFRTLTSPSLWILATMHGSVSLTLVINVFISNLITLPAVMAIPWLILHSLGLRLPWHLIALSILFPLLELAAIFLFSFTYPSWVFILFNLLSYVGTGLIFWRLAYRRADTQIDPGVFA